MLRIFLDTLKTQSIMGGLLIGLILIVRAVFSGQLSARQMRFLWLLAVVRLALPLELPNILLTAPQEDGENAPVRQVQVEIVEGEQTLQNDLQPTSSLQDTYSAQESMQPRSTASATQTQARTARNAQSGRRLSAGEVAFGVWICGFAGLGAYMTAVNVRGLGRLRAGADLTMIDCPVPVYEADVESPCIAGVFRARIYIARGSAGDPGIPYAIRHELSHWRAHDNFWLLARNILLMVYWFHPLVWLAARIAENDTEAACDERVIRTLSREEQLNYAEALIRFNADRRKAEK